MIFAGIDVSKAQLDVAVRAGTEELWSTPNDPAGIRSLTERLLAHSPALVVLEATGGFEVAVTAALALFAERVRPEVRPLPDAAAQELQAVLTRRRQIIEMITAEKDRLGFATAAQVRRGIEKYIRWLEKQLQEINSDLDRHIRHSPLWRAKDDLLRSVPGVGPNLSRTLIAELPELGRLSRKEIAALVGIAPLARDSGTLRGKRMIWGGRASVRTALYLSIWSASRHNPLIRPFYERLRAAGKPPKVAQIACMRKLLTILNAMVRDSVAWNPESSLQHGC